MQIEDFVGPNFDLRKLKGIEVHWNNIKNLPGHIADLGCGDGVSTAFLLWLSAGLLQNEAESEDEESKVKIVCALDQFPTVWKLASPCVPADDLEIDEDAGVSNLEAYVASKGLVESMEYLDVIPGQFSETLKQCLPPELCLAHIDCDTYEGTKEALEATYPRLVEGGYCFIDDYGIGWTPCVQRAVDEFLAGKQEVLNQTLHAGQAWFVKV